MCKWPVCRHRAQLHELGIARPRPEARANLKKFVEEGKGLVLVHFACGAFQGWPEFKQIAGRVYNPSAAAPRPVRQVHGHDRRRRSPGQSRLVSVLRKIFREDALHGFWPRVHRIL